MAGDLVARGPDVQVAGVELPQEAARVCEGVLLVQADEHHPPVVSLLPGALEQRRLLSARVTPRGPEVDHHGRPAQLPEVHSPIGERRPDRAGQPRADLALVENRQVEPGRRNRLRPGQGLIEGGLWRIGEEAIGQDCKHQHGQGHGHERPQAGAPATIGLSSPTATSSSSVAASGSKTSPPGWPRGSHARRLLQAEPRACARGARRRRCRMCTPRSARSLGLSHMDSIGPPDACTPRSRCASQ